MKISIEIIVIVVTIGLYVGFINPSTDSLLILCAIAIYIIDSSITLFSNEFLIFETFGRWKAFFPSTRWRVFRKMLTILNLFTPNILPFKGYWDTQSHDLNEEDIDDFIRTLMPLRIMAILSFILVFVSIPAAIFLLRDDALILLLIIILYLNAFMSLIIVWVNRRSLRISNNFFYKLAFDSMLCIPLAINMARKISLNYQWNENILRFSKNRFYLNEYIDFIGKLIERVEISMRIAGENTDKYAELVKYKETLEACIS